MRAFPYLRVQELSSSAGVPEPFQLVASVPTPDPFALERAIHAFYASVRKYGRKKEFFLLSREEAVYHFHVRSLDAMGSGVSTVVEKVKKRKIGNTESEKRKHVRHFENDEEEVAFKNSIAMFLQMHIQVSEDGFLLTKCMKESFAERIGQISNDQLFFKFLRDQMKHIFPTSIICDKRLSGKRERGYTGIAFKQM
jgi:hypothetical protein